MSTTTPLQGTLVWNIDPAHSGIDFSIKHMGIFSVKGSLGTVSGTVETTDSALSKVSLSVDLSTFSTKNEQRDAHVKSADFLDVEKYPTATFVSTAISGDVESGHTVTGDLTLHGQTHPVTLEAEIVPPVKDPWGLTRGGATGTGSIKRTEWGLTYNSVMDTGHVLLGEDVKFTFDLQATLPA